MRPASWWRRAAAALGARRHRRAHHRPSAGPTCRVVLDLRRVPWGGHPATAGLLLRQRPGVLDVSIDARRRRAIVVHDARTSLPQLWNWLVAQPTTADPPTGHQVDR